MTTEKQKALYKAFRYVLARKQIIMKLLLHLYLTRCLKKRAPLWKLVQFLYLSRNLSKILCDCSKMILLCSVEDSKIQVLQQEVTS